ncbi:MAG: MBL fold metallo-hydrolase [Tannerellaceae bacterium]|jgi:glyoxylase-like metal-dependent hydrolase (beta-lactamase superfamily II)|nr:MBL fold metallo-hydrolase [Tannerellaceae bacterium]
MKRLVLICLAAALMLRAAAQDEAAVITYTAGDFFVSILSEGGSTASAGLLKGASAGQLTEFVPDGTFMLETQVFLLRAKGKNILIDTGYGRHLFDNLLKPGLAREQIDAVMLTHLHPDHTGGLLLKGEAAFPNAKLYLSAAEYGYRMALYESSALRAAIEAYGDRLVLFEPEAIDATAEELLPGIRAVKAYGHTPGHCGYLISSEEERWLIWGDLVHAMTIQMPCPEVGIAFDADSEQAADSRKAILEYAAKNRITVGGMHVPFPAVGTVSAGKAGQDGAFVFTPLCLCEGF